MLSIINISLLTNFLKFFLDRLVLKIKAQNPLIMSATIYESR